MSHPEEMRKIKIIVPKVYGSPIISALYHLGALHVQSYSKGKLQNLDTGAPLAPAEEVSQMLLELRSAKERLGIKGSGSPTQRLGRLAPLRKRIKKLASGTAEHNARLKSLEQERTQLNDMIENAEALEKWGVSAEKLQRLRHSAFFVGSVKDISILKQKLHRLDYDLKRAEKGDSDLVLVLVQKSDEQKASLAAAEAGLATIPLEKYGGVTASQLRQRLRSCEQETELVGKSLQELRQEEKFILDHEVLLEEEIKKAELPLQFASTAQAFIATGYVPAKELDAVKKRLAAVAKGSIHIEEEHIEHDEHVPVRLHNTKTVKNFEVLTRLYELPSYFEFDPSSLLFVTFPLFFGIMLGDVGYGIATLLLFLFLKKKFSGGKALFNVLIYASIVTIAFGFVFGEYLGYEHISMEKGKQLCEAGICFNKEIIEEHGERTIVYSFPRLLSRMEGRVNLLGFELYSVLVLGVVVGAIHLNIGFLIGFYNVWKQHGVKLAILEKLSWIVLEVGLAGVVLSLLGLIILQWWVGAAVALAGVVMLCFGEGVRGIIEILGLVTNMLSYMRLGAVGLASVGLAVVINEHLAQPFFEKGGVYVLIAIIVMVIGHAINLALGIIGPFLHGIRLHYVECFSKFFHGGGIQYNPFGVKNDN